MKNLIILAVLAAVAYYGYTTWLPERQAKQAAEAAATEQNQQALYCVGAAESANREFANQIRTLGQPPIDPAAWSTVMVRLSGDLSSADNACACPAPACSSAAAALLEMRRRLNQLDALMRGKPGGSSNPATAQERINSLLERARREAG